MVLVCPIAHIYLLTKWFCKETFFCLQLKDTKNKKACQVAKRITLSPLHAENKRWTKYLLEFVFANNAITSFSQSIVAQLEGYIL